MHATVETGTARVLAREPLGADAAIEIGSDLTNLVADVFTLYVKTKNFHWHISGRHFRDYHLLLDEQADQLLGMIDPIAERCRKVGSPTIGSIGEIARRQRLKDCDLPSLSPKSMLTQLHVDNLMLLGLMRDAHARCERHNDVASTSALENWIDETEQRIWFLREATREAHGSTGETKQESTHA